MKIMSAIIVTLLLASWVNAQVEEPNTWQLTEGDEWEYAVVLELPRGVELPKEDQANAKKTADGQEVRYNEVQRYLGKKKIKKNGEAFDAFAVMRDGKLQSTEYMQITDKGIFGRGSKPAGKDPDGKEKKTIFLAQPLLLVSFNSKAGEIWKIASPPNKDGVIVFLREFRAFGKEKVKTPAGEFEALKIEASGLNGSIELRREYWFEPKNGFVKEVKTYYTKEKRLMRQSHELTKFTKANDKIQPAVEKEAE